MNPIVTINVKRNFTPEEMNEKGDALAQITIEKLELENEKAEVAKEYGNQIKGKEAEINTLAKQIKAGCEEIPTECEVLLNFPEDGKKTIVNFETRETILEQEMTETDYNLFSQPNENVIPMNDEENGIEFPEEVEQYSEED